ncbi:MAG TPA: hypothetical protein VFI86_00550, partial [Burkholderiales bacterium]|nr:hypothetical protein [Burkholderiales bacterium]
MRERRPMPELCSAGLGIAFLSVPGAFLPLDLVYAVPGILTYATRAQFAAIYLAAFSLALLAGLVAWGLGVATSVAVPRAGARVGLALVALAVLHGFVVWLDSLYHFSPATQNAGTAGALAVSLALGAFFGARLAEASLRSLFVLLRAVFLIVAAAAVG